MKNSKRDRIFKRLDEGATPTTIHREFSDRLEACGWLYILKLAKEHTKLRQTEQGNDKVVELHPR